MQQEHNAMFDPKAVVSVPAPIQPPKQVTLTMNVVQAKELKRLLSNVNADGSAYAYGDKTPIDSKNNTVFGLYDAPCIADVDNA